MEKKRATELAIIAGKVRKNALTAIYSAASGHPGGSLSVADVLTYLYCEVMKVDAKTVNRMVTVLTRVKSGE